MNKETWQQTPKKYRTLLGNALKINLYFIKLESPKEWINFLANANNQKDNNNFNRIINYEETETLIKRFSAKTMPRPNSQRVQSFTVQQTFLKLEEKKRKRKGMEGSTMVLF